ncbi:cupin domain-containing protein [Acidovorax sp. NCPPB 3859]|nr:MULTISPECIES: cupin domain-containing protein [unclassified Acidovorax]MDA8448935.1 cupin domain-containing protein [Acidovorax sp. GBBC 3297]MDA8457946.1 cupin domain-containing protein [Acidovorax sp. GBBC 3333]MDA8462984.1 cupin domain-containing protein [Acidovorax sp. GBBC 3332]MDA8468411.1 cupin domain-containing protein [Acidovorax sp. GBBC 3299]WCM80008.1 cupin domain-containing protein [Acidovorax sp. GBBC 712]
MDTHTPLPLLGGITPAQFMRRHWQKKPLLVRQAVASFVPPVGRQELFALAAQETVESRLVQQKKGAWSLRHGPFARRALPPLATPDWTLLVQGVDLHDDAVHALLQQFRFVPQARLDDLMISYATDGGGVGPHFDSYDVFLLQAHGRRRWRIGRQKDLALKDGIPLKILENFEPEQEFVLEPGDMLYLPPRWAHDGIAEGECMTYSIGFRSPSLTGLAQDLLTRLSDGPDEEGALSPHLYRDPAQDAADRPGEIPAALLDFARDALARALAEPLAVERALGESLTEPKPNVWFEPGDPDADVAQGVRLDRRTRMMYDARHVFINGESYLAGGRDATLMRRLADQRELAARDLVRASEDALELLASWCDAGWVHARRAG